MGFSDICMPGGSPLREGDRFQSRSIADWREKQQAKAAVMQTLKIELRRLPAQYTRDLRSEKLARAYAHVYGHFPGGHHNAP